MDGTRNYLGERHTINYLRGGEILYTKLGERRSFEQWARSGSKSIVDSAQTEVERILAEHEVPPLSDDQEKELDEILLAAQTELVSHS